MPTVPYPQRQVSTEPLPGVRVSPEAPAAAFAGAVPHTPDLSGVERVVDQMHQDAVNKANQVVVLDGVAQLGQLKSNLYTQLQSLHGKDAMAAPDQIHEQWQQGISQITGRMSANQQEMFQQHAVAEGLDLDASMQRHVAAEQQQLDVDTYKANDQNIETDAVHHASEGDFSGVAADVDRRKANAQMFAQRNGLPDDVAQAQIAQAASQTHAAVLGQMLAAHQDLTAKAYYDQHKDELVGDDLTRATAAVQSGSIRAEAQKQSDAITAKATGLGDALDQAKAIGDPDVRDQTESRLRVFYNEQADAQRQAREAGVQQGANIVEQTHDVAQIPPQVWSTFTVGERDSLRDYAEKLSKGQPVATDWKTYYTLTALASSDATKDQFLKTNLMQYRPDLADEQFKQIVELQASLRKGDPRASHQLDGFRTRQEIVNGALSGIGIDPTISPKNKHVDQVVTFNRMVQARAVALEQQTGKPSTADDVQRITDNLLVNGIVSGSGGLFGASHETVFGAAQKGDKLILSSSDIPTAERQAIVSTLKARGLPVTEQSIISLYTRKLGAGLP